MITGFRLASMLAFRREAVRTEIVRAARRFFDSERRLNILRVKEALAWRSYGQNATDDLPVSQSILDVLDARQARAMDFLADASLADEEIARLAGEREKAVRRAANAKADFEAQESRVLEKWRNSPQCIDLKKRLAEIDAKERAIREEAEGPYREERLREMEKIRSDRFVSYLLARGYGTPQYSGRGISRLGDRWLARTSRFQDAAKALNQLENWPKQVEAALQNCREEREELRERLRKAEKAALSELDPLRPALAEALNELHEAETRHGDLVARREAAMKGIASAISGNDETYIAMIDSFVNFLTKEKGAALQKIARGEVEVTSDPRLDRLSSERIRLSMETDTLRRHIALAIRRLKGVEDVSDRLAAAGFDTESTRFDLDEHGFLPETLADGQITPDEAWGNIQRALVQSAHPVPARAA